MSSVDLPFFRVTDHQPTWAKTAEAVNMLQRTVRMTEGLLERATVRDLYVIISEVGYIGLLGVQVVRDDWSKPTT